MKTNDNKGYKRSELVDALIGSEYQIDSLGECKTESVDYILLKSVETIAEWIGRVPHFYPFNLAKKKTKYRYELTFYQDAFFTCISEVSLMMSGDDDTSPHPYRERSPIYDIVVNGVKEWLLALQKSNVDVFNLIFGMEPSFYRIQSDEDKEIIQKNVNDLSFYLRTLWMLKGNREKVHSYRRNATEISRQMINVAKQGFCNTSKILLCRFDSGYRYRVPDMRGKFSSREDYEIRFKRVSAMRDQMLKILRKMVGRELIFFFWKIECGPFKGLHIHWFIGLNGHIYRDRINDSREIADAWNVYFKNDDFYTYNLSSHQKHEDAILRVIEYSDPLLGRILGGYADYLSKVDYLGKLRAPGNMHTFGGTKLKKIQKSKRGPKRSKQMHHFDALEVRRPLQELSKEMGWQEYKG